MVHSVQVIEKNHFLDPQNRVTIARMSETEKKHYWILQVLVAAAIVIATLAPVAVLAG